MSLSTRLKRIILDLEDLRADCSYSDETEPLDHVIEELNNVHLWSDTVS
jgi:hypothetical protein